MDCDVTSLLAMTSRGIMKTEELKELIIKLLEEKKAENITAIELPKSSPIAHYIVFATGRSTKNVGAIASYVADELKKAGLPRIGLEGFEKSEWALIDTGDIVVHILHPEAREHYRLEEMWEKRK